jgi:hypothetical protein
MSFTVDDIPTRHPNPSDLDIRQETKKMIQWYIFAFSPKAHWIRATALKNNGIFVY